MNTKKLNEELKKYLTEDFKKNTILFSDPIDWGLEIVLESTDSGYQVFSHLLNTDEWIKDSDIHVDWKRAIDQAINNFAQEDDMLFDLSYGSAYSEENEYAQYLLAKINYKLEEE